MTLDGNLNPQKEMKGIKMGNKINIKINYKYKNQLIRIEVKST